MRRAPQLGQNPRFAAERQQMLGVAGVATYPQEAVLQPATSQIVLEFTLHVIRQRPALAGHEVDKLWVVLIDDPVEQGLLGSVALVTVRTSVPVGSSGRER
jgi:hypothetical protein